MNADLNLNILIVDDDKEIASIYREQLIAKGHRAEICIPGHQSCSLLDSDWSGYDLIVSDKIMPVNVDEILERAERFQVPVMIITGEISLDPPDADHRFCNCFNKLDLIGKFPATVEDFYQSLLDQKS